MLVSDVCFPLHCVGSVWIVFWYGFGEVGAWSDSKPCKSRPSGSTSPKRELQNLTLSSDSWFSPRRPRRGLSDMVSRSGERHSPKWGREENLEVLSAISRPGEMFWVLSDWHSRLGESSSPKQVREVFSCVCVWLNTRLGEVGCGFRRIGGSPRRGDLA